jgi:hypothetical protein
MHSCIYHLTFIHTCSHPSFIIHPIVTHFIHFHSGLLSFLPLAAQLQLGGVAASRGLVVVYRLPWAEVCRLRYHFPQWSAVRCVALTW